MKIKNLQTDGRKEGTVSFLSAASAPLRPPHHPPLPQGTALGGGKHCSELWSCATGFFRECCKSTASCLVGKWDQGRERETAGGREEASGPSRLLAILDERKRADRATCRALNTAFRQQQGRSVGPWLRLGIVKTHCRKPLPFNHTALKPSNPPDTLEANCHLSEGQTGAGPSPLPSALAHHWPSARLPLSGRLKGCQSPQSHSLEEGSSITGREEVSGREEAPAVQGTEEESRPT